MKEGRKYSNVVNQVNENIKLGSYFSKSRYGYPYGYTCSSYLQGYIGKENTFSLHCEVK